MRDSITIPNSRYISMPESLRLSEAAVPQVEDATEIAEILCRIFNRILKELGPHGNINTVLVIPPITAFAELTALFRWRADVDTTLIDTYEYITHKSDSRYRRPKWACQLV